MVRLFVFSAIFLLGSGISVASAQDDALYDSWEKAISFREHKQFDEAVEIFRSLLTEYAESEDISRRAYNQLVFTYTQDGNRDSEETAAREALARYPDLMADTVFIPQGVNDLYDRLRREMFGSIAIRKPEECQIYLDGTLMGETPLYLPYVPVGDYLLKVTRDKHHDYEEQIVVEPDGRHNFEIAMTRRKDTMYWLTRVGGGAILAGTIVLLASGGSDDVVEAIPLPGAPPPPSR